MRDAELMHVNEDRATPLCFGARLRQHIFSGGPMNGTLGIGMPAIQGEVPAMVSSRD